MIAYHMKCSDTYFRERSEEEARQSGRKKAQKGRKKRERKKGYARVWGEGGVGVSVSLYVLS